MQNHNFQRKPSLFYLFYVCSIAAMSFMVVIELPVNFAIKMLGILLLTIYFSHLFWHEGLLRGKKAIIYLQYQANGHWLIEIQNRLHAAKLSGHSTVTTWVSVLRFRLPDRYWPITCVIFKDSFKEDDYRKLTVILRQL